MTKGGLKRKARHRVMPLHPQLLRLGIQRYVEAIEAEGHSMIFPELYLPEAKHARASKVGDRAHGEEGGGVRWQALLRDQLVLPDGCDAQHHAACPRHRTARRPTSIRSAPTTTRCWPRPRSVRPSSTSIWATPRKGTGPRRYMRRALALGEVQELRERLDVMIKQMPIVTDHVPVQHQVNLSR